jgi:cytochrome c-type biogenesis protein CcmF
MNEWGYSAFIAGLVIAVLQIVGPFVFYNKSPVFVLRWAQGTALFQFIFVSLAFLVLLFSYITSDFTVLNVALNSSRLTPLIYKIAGVWGNHEGSMLLWVIVLNLYGVFFAFFYQEAKGFFVARALSFQALIAVCFYVFMLIASNPFLSAPVFLKEGYDLNPLLQDPSMMLHPPSLYLGYVGFSLVYSLTLAGLVEKKIDSAWARRVRFWLMIAWIFLTLGIAGGSFWAYYELGWGGWWFWDPVENVSLLPWLAATALLHSLKLFEKRNILKGWSVLLALLCFAFSLLGTFIVRSGLLTSVHSFATDSERGAFLLAVFFGLVGLGFIIFAFRKETLHSIPSSQKGPLFSSLGMIVLNNLFLMTLAFTVLIGTLYPLFMEGFLKEKISVGPPYFHIAFVPFAIALMLLGGFSLAVKDKQRIGDIVKALHWPLTLVLVAGLVILYKNQNGSFLAFAGCIASLWLMSATAFSWLFKIRSFLPHSFLMNLKSLPLSFHSAFLAHLGFAVCAFGMSADTLWKEEHQVALVKDRPFTFQGYSLVLKNIILEDHATYQSEVAYLEISKGKKALLLKPERRFYKMREVLTTETALLSDFFSNVYVALGDSLKDGRRILRLYYHSQVMFIWIGSLLMALGGGLLLFQRNKKTETQK